MKLQNFEIDKALEELNTSNEKKAYKIVGNVMISKSMEELKKELNETKETIDVRLKGFEKMEEKLTSKLKDLQEKLQGMMK